MFYCFKDIDHDFNEFKMSYFRAAQFKQARPLTTVVAMRVIKFLSVFVCSTSLFNGDMSGGSTRGKAHCGGGIRFAVILLFNSRDIWRRAFRYTHYIS